jgi:hypothetical protein
MIKMLYPDATSVIFFNYAATGLTSKKLDGCDILCFKDVRNGAVGNNSVPYIGRAVLEECQRILSRIRMNVFDLHIFAANYTFICAGANQDAAFQSLSFTSYADWIMSYQKVLKTNPQIGCFNQTSFYLLSGGFLLEEPIKAGRTLTNLNGTDGSICTGCSNFVPYAESNQSNNTYVCFNCR